MKLVRARLARASLVGAVLGSLLLGGTVQRVAAASCIPTGAQDRDGTPLTARVVNPSKPVTGRIDARGCEVGIYFSRGTSGLVVGAEIFGARYYGVLVDGNGHDVAADVRGSSIHDIGETPITSDRHGQGIAYRGFEGGTARGTALGNRVWNYQEAGLNMTGPGTTATFVGNVVQGRGKTDVISQNGIQVIFGAHGVVRANAISDLRFLGPNVGNGILVVGGPAYGFPYTRDARLEANVITGADVGINIFEAEEDFSPSPQPTRIVVAHNVIHNGAWTNHEGWDVGVGMQVGIADYANSDVIRGNVVSGIGYHAETCGDAGVCTQILTDDSIDPFVSGNVLR
ncbi:MAG TPA: hypothetical protein VH440_10780 [Candidatus Limnocylindrales bacterium]|jgi:hypothetical protein